MQKVLEVKNLKKTFAGKVVLEDISFAVQKGETFGFLGPSGSGKTTTIKILTAQLKDFAGDVTVFGQHIKEIPRETLMRNIGVVTDNSALYERLTVLDNLLLYCDLFNIAKSRIDEVLAELNMLAEKKNQVKKLSKGMKQRILLARALLHKPQILFLDEPTSALDPLNANQIHAILRELNREGTTIFLTTHDMYEADKICDTVAFLHQGTIREIGNPSVLRKKYATASNEPSIGDIFIQVAGEELHG